MISRKTGKCFCLIRIKRLDIEKDQIGFERSFKSSALTVDAGRVDRDMDPLFVKRAGECKTELGLTERLASGDSHTARLDVISVAEDLTDHLLDGVLFPALGAPGVGVVAELASQGAALKEQHETKTRSIDRAERLYRMHISFHLLHTHLFFSLA